MGDIRIVIADDDPFTREGLDIILRKAGCFEVIAAVENGRRAVDVCRTKEVDIALLDIRMPVLNGVEAVKALREDCPGVKAVILTTFEEDDLIRDAVRNGAWAYVLKGKSAAEITNILRVVHSGTRVFQNSVFEKIQSGLEEPRGDLAPLSEREREVMKLVAEGLSNKEIGEKLFLSEGTIKNYVSSILFKLDLKQRTQIAVYYLKGGE